MIEHENLAAALVAALPDLTVLDTNRTANAGSYSYKYADIADAVKATRPVLAEHGIVLLTPVHAYGDDGLACTVILLHTSGDKLEFPPFPFPHGRDAQATGSMVTYHRRYALIAALGMAAGDDDDGANAHARTKTQTAPPPFNLARFKRTCSEAGLDPYDVLGYAELDKTLEMLTEDDRPALKAALAALSQIAGGGDTSGAGSENGDAPDLGVTGAGPGAPPPAAREKANA